MKKQCTDHLGNTFESISTMCRYYGVSYDTYASRLHNGWSLEKALSVDVGVPRGSSSGTKCYDHKGNCYNSLRKMADRWGIDEDTLSRRLRAGWTVERALTAPLGKSKRRK